MAPLRLRHIHLPSAPALGRFPSYEAASAVQEVLRRRLLQHKDADPSSPSSAPPPPPPTVLTFTPRPIYTLGRRLSLSSLAPAQLARLRAPLSVAAPGAGGGTFSFRPSVAASPRGGLTTYHGPGQVVLWPVLDLRGLGGRHAAFTVRGYARLLEDTTAAVLRRLWGLEGFTTADPGVWVRGGRGRAGVEGGGPRKIAAMGVYLRRHVSSLGTALNLDMPTAAASPPPPPGTCGGPAGAEGSGPDDERTNPWARFVACGLEGKGVTCVRAEAGRGAALDPAAVAAAWADELAARLGVEGVEAVGEEGVAAVLREAEAEAAPGEGAG